jgi:Protein of unknown function (DUF3106)
VTRAKEITGWLAASLLAAAVSVPCLAQKGTFHPAQSHPPQQGHPNPAPRSQPNRQAQVRQHPRGHAGDWLRRYKDLPPAEQERALQNDPGFRKLSPEQQQRLRQRLQHFSDLPPQQQLRVLNRMETWEHLTPQQKQQALQIFGQMRQLPPDRQRVVRTAVRDLAAMPPDQRERVIDSDRFKGMFSDQERDIIRGAARLPLAPQENGESGPANQ